MADALLIGDELVRLGSAFNRKLSEAQKQVWIEELEGFPDNAITAAVTKVIHSSEKFPPLSEVYQTARAHERSRIIREEIAESRKEEIAPTREEFINYYAFRLLESQILFKQQFGVGEANAHVPSLKDRDQARDIIERRIAKLESEGRSKMEFAPNYDPFADED